MAAALVVAWSHLQTPPQGTDEPPREPGVPFERPERIDPVWDALAQHRDGKAGRSFDEGYADIRGDLEARRLVVDSRSILFHPLPDLRGREWGRIWAESGVGAALFRPRLSLNTDGPTLPAVEMMRRLLEREAPRLVLSVGLGGGVVAEHQVGDVVVATAAEFALAGELATMAVNGETHRSSLTIEQQWFSDLEFDEQQELPLLPPSPSYPQPVGGWPQPPPHRPMVRVAGDLPVQTRPAISAPSFIPGRLGHKDRPADPGGRCAAIDMDAAAAAKACGEAEVPFVAVIGVAVPALRRPLPAHLAEGWAEAFRRHFGLVAAANAVRVAERIVERTA